MENGQMARISREEGRGEMPEGLNWLAHNLSRLVTLAKYFIDVS